MAARVKTWADPGKQCIPVAWQNDTLSQMASHVYDYMKNAITTLIAAGGRPDLVQVGNEITPGLLIHICDADGHPTSTNTVNGRTSNWANTAMLLKEGIRGVKEVDANIKTVLHIDKGGEHPVQAGVGLGLFINDDSGTQLADAWPIFEAEPTAMGVYDGMRSAYANRL